MNINLNRKLMLAAAVVIMLNFNSCGKYDDGPKFSLKTKTSRLVGEWEVVKVDGDKITDADFILEFEKGGDFKATYTYEDYGSTYTDVYDGEWEWDSKKEVIKVDFDDGYNADWEVMRLTNDELWFEDEDKMYYECEKK
ncbi:MAG: lipocalin family protein [Saprospiraceae bacterium]|nr:lipocalin family protein [Saprospiraceae bacterium]